MQGMVAVGTHRRQASDAYQSQSHSRRDLHEPGIGSVGLTEAQARAQGAQVKIGKFPFMANSKATILGQHDGFVKVVADEKYGEILGVHIIGTQAFELIAEAVAAMEAEATVETLMQTIHAHPTLYEAVGEAFNAVYGLAINVSNCCLPATRPDGLRGSLPSAARTGGGPQARRDSGSACLIVEHPHIITLGRNGKREHLAGQPRRSASAPALRFRKPTAAATSPITARARSSATRLSICANGSAMSSPMCARIEQVLIDTLADFGIGAERVAGPDRRLDRRPQDRGHRRSHQPLGDVARLRAERRYGSQLFSVHRSRAALHAGDFDGGTGRARRPRSKWSSGLPPILEEFSSAR